MGMPCKSRFFCQKVHHLVSKSKNLKSSKNIYVLHEILLKLNFKLGFLFLQFKIRNYLDSFFIIFNGFGLFSSKYKPKKVIVFHKTVLWHKQKKYINYLIEKK